jgi:hypothetical protein
MDIKNVVRQTGYQIVEDYKFYIYVVATVTLMVRHHMRGRN